MFSQLRSRRLPDEAGAHFLAWILLTLALAVHVTDEALTGFLSVYNPTVLAIREQIPWLPLPVFTFRVWLTLLILGIIALLVMSRWVLRGSRWTIYASYPFALMIGLANGCGHIAGSLYRRAWMPGVYSSPLLLAASIYLLVETSRRLRENGAV